MCNYSSNELIEGSNKVIPSVVIVGKTNVGKSSLFNRLVGDRMTIISKEINTTRDSVSHVFDRTDKVFELIDTAGIDENFFKILKSKTGAIYIQIYDKIEQYIKKSDLVILILDIGLQVTIIDTSIINKLRSYQKKLILVVNKADTEITKKENEYNFYELPLDHKDIYFTSCIHDIGIKKLFGRICNIMPKNTDLSITDNIRKDRTAISIIGYPNVGKSSLFNRLLNDDRSIIDDNPGTTRDIIGEPIEFDIDNTRIPTYVFDTPGIKPRRKTNNIFEQFGYSRVLDKIFQSDILIVLVRPIKSLNELYQYDIKICNFLVQNNKHFVIVVSDYKNSVDDKKSFIHYVDNVMHQKSGNIPIIFLDDPNSLKNIKVSIKNIFLDFKCIKNIRKNKINGSIFNELFTKITFQKKIPNKMRECYIPKIYYMKIDIIERELPKFIFFVNNPKLFNNDIISLLEKFLRKKYNLSVLAINIELRKS